jgi:hypothetical protein
MDPWLMLRGMTNRDQIGVLDWIRLGRSVLTKEQLARVIMTLIDDDVLVPMVSTPAVVPAAAQTAMQTHSAEPDPAKQIPTPDPQLSVPKLVMHFVRHIGRAIRAGDALAYVKGFKPDVPRTSVYSALNQLTKTNHLDKQGEGKGVTYTMHVAPTGKKGGTSSR